jgi:glycerophosphoryl diester phosphodiesterase
MPTTRPYGFRIFALLAVLILSLGIVSACSSDASAPLDGDSDLTTDGDLDGDMEVESDPDTDPDGDTDAELDVDTEEMESDFDVEDEQEQPPRPSPAACILDSDCALVMVSAHRGYHEHNPENSLSAIRATARVHADFSEVDPRETSDGYLVLMHDDTVDRTTDGSGKVNEHTLAELQAMTLNGGDPTDPESSRIPLFVDALAVAREEGLMLYVDMKTDRQDLILEAVQSGDYYEQALIRKDANVVAQMLESDPNLIVMPPVESSVEFDAVLGLIPRVKIVEIALPGKNADLTAAIRSAGVKVQQDVMAAGDIRAYTGNYTGWKEFVEAGVFLLQTDFPQLLVPAVELYNNGGEFPDEGPAPEL